MGENISRLRKNVSFIIKMINLSFLHKRYQNPLKFVEGGKPEIDKWTISEFVFRNLVPIIGIRPFPLDEQMLMTSVVVWHAPDYVFEWGTHVGKSARLFNEIRIKFKMDFKIYSVDLPPDVYHIEQPGESRGVYVKNIKQVKLLLGDGLDKSLQVLKKINNEKKVLFFLDGDHSYKSVMRELRGISKSRPGAAIIIHDTFYQVKKSKYNIGPNLAVKNFCKKNNHYTTISTNFGLPGMIVLLPKNK